MFIRNAWYAAALGHEVQSSELFSRKILGATLVFFRKGDGSIAVLRDRCSHRFAPLSLGRQEGDNVRCMYHGLVFTPEGQCIEEPGRKGAVQNIRVACYPAQEKHKLIWVWMGDPKRADPALIPDCHHLDDDDWNCDLRYNHFKSEYRLVLDNLLDFSHLGFVHETTFGSPGVATIQPKVEQTKDGVKLTRWYLNETEFAPYLKGYERFSGPVDRWNNYHLSTKSNHFSMSSGSAPAGTGAPEGRFAPETMEFYSHQLITPEDERNTHYFWSYAQNFALDDRALTLALADRIGHGFAEDRRMIEAQQKNIDESGDDRMAFILADRAPSLGRRLIEKCLTAEAAEQSTSRTFSTGSDPKFAHST